VGEWRNGCFKIWRYFCRKSKSNQASFEVVNAIPESKVVVVSALSGVTDSLIKASSLAKMATMSMKRYYRQLKTSIEKYRLNYLVVSLIL